MFDDDNIINEGDAGEYEIVITIGQYVNGGNMNHSLVWSAPGIPVGSYFVYAWVDVANADVFDANPNYHEFFDATGDFYYNAGSIDSFLDPVNLVPNYAVTDSFAAQLFFSFDDAV